MKSAHPNSTWAHRPTCLLQSDGVAQKNLQNDVPTFFLGHHRILAESWQATAYPLSTGSGTQFCCKYRVMKKALYRIQLRNSSLSPKFLLLSCLPQTDQELSTPGWLALQDPWHPLQAVHNDLQLETTSTNVKQWNVSNTPYSYVFMYSLWKISQVIQNLKTSQACDLLHVHAFVCISVLPTPRHPRNSHQVALIQWLCCRCHPSKKRLHQHRGSKPLQGTTGATWLFYSTTPQRDSITRTICVWAWTWMPTKHYKTIYIYIYFYVCMYKIV